MVRTAKQAIVNGSQSPYRVNPQFLRIGAIACAFLSTTVALVWVQPNDRNVPSQQQTSTIAQPAPEEEVSRAETNLTGSENSVSLEEREASSSSQSSDNFSDRISNLSYTSASTSPQNLFSEKQSQLESLVIEALRQGQSEEYIDALVNHVAAKGTVEVPGALVTPGGQVDTATLLTTLSSAQEADTSGAELYTVQPGDSLASISFRFFGSTSYAGEIFAANSDLLSETGAITVGQELVIPSK